MMRNVIQKLSLNKWISGIKTMPKAQTQEFMFGPLNYSNTLLLNSKKR